MARRSLAVAHFVLDRLGQLFYLIGFFDDRERESIFIALRYFGVEFLREIEKMGGIGDDPLLALGVALERHLRDHATHRGVGRSFVAGVDSGEPIGHAIGVWNLRLLGADGDRSAQGEKSNRG